MITISTENLFKIIYVALAIVHIIIYLIVFIKIRGITKNKPITLNDMWKGLKSGFSNILNFLSPVFPNIIGLIKQITSGEKKDDNDDESEGKSNG